MITKACLNALCAAALLLCGCGASSVSVKEGSRTYTPADYDEVYRNWTRTADAFSFGTLNDVLNVTATWMSWEFRWAYVVRFANDHGYGTDERESLMQSSLAMTKEELSFFVTLAGNNFRESNLASDHSAWRVLLVDSNGKQFSPAKIERIRRPNASERTYFPSISSFREVFRISFSRSAVSGGEKPSFDGPELILRFAGADGVVDLKWRVTP